MIWTPRVVAALASLALVACSSGSAPDAPPIETPEAAENADPVNLRVLAFNDLHGALEGPSGKVWVDGEKVETGGAAYLAAHINAERDAVDHALVLAAGDLIGASPLVSALLHDEPTIEVMNAIGLVASSVGNHEFDEGYQELLRIAEGGCHPTAGCREGYTYEGPTFSYLAANVRITGEEDTLLPPYIIRDIDGVKVAIIGMTLEDTPSAVVPTAVEGLEFYDEVETVKALLPQLEAEDVATAIVLLHEGGVIHGEQRDIGECPDVQGAIVPIAEAMPPLVSVIVTGHTHAAYVCEFGGKLVTAAQSFGRVVTAIDMTIDRQTGEVLERSARQRAVTHDVEPDPEIATLIDTYAEISAPLAERVVGSLTAPISRERDATGQSPLGKLIADAQLAATAGEDIGGAQVAFMNPGGIRSSLEPNAEGNLTFADLHTCQPFGNTLVTMTLTGQQIHTLLEQQWVNPDRTHMLGVSEGFSYTWNADAPTGERVDASSIVLNGEVIDQEANYRVTVNTFLSTGGDGFTVLAEGKERVVGPIDLDALVTYVEENSPLTAPEDARVMVIGEATAAAE
ncbi:bifunctional metallophosphatase/5'-nucleotidase [Lujinxingia sediminis]|uniref:Bifunctional metallophosphatase/5'-nucleotidase n=1 Tax=Lujinxingia sediminis TaxID=2480984 RepID=A0ABY0CRL6_9DELT|nr:bifunctional UDP-sugar hydrolase/5'-nucleotidase [Lujinxingia sediminis]RVU42774.1 bifunctional metallophosphatase/5'-nucleotidase [Lujinxingia sediminis]